MVTAVKRPAGETRGKVAAGPHAGQCHRASPRPYHIFGSRSLELEDLGGNWTRVTYSLEVDHGRVLSLVIRGPLVDLLRGMLLSTRAGELKRAIESG